MEFVESPINSRNPLVINCLSANREKFDATQLFNCNDLSTHPVGVYMHCMEITDDGFFLVSEAGQGSILLRPMELILSSYPHHFEELEGCFFGQGVGSLAVSLDGSRIFSGDAASIEEIADYFPTVLIHDSQT